MLRAFHVCQRLNRDALHRSQSVINQLFSQAKYFHDNANIEESNQIPYYIGTQHYSFDEKKENLILICGDGDLSYSASLSQEFAQKNVKIIASVLESEEDHSTVYRDSQKNTKLIKEYGHNVRYSIDATNLKASFDNVLFDRIQFNFPHWRGKTNHRHNRKLISNFFESSSLVLTDSGQIHMALMEHQGAAFANNLDEWKQSWMPARYAANNNLLLTHVLPFEPRYNLSSYQWRDRPFHSRRGNPFMYIFSNADGITKAPANLQLYSYFNIFIRLSTNIDGETMSQESFSNPQYINKLIRDVVPDGVNTDTEFLQLVDGSTLQNPQEYFFAEYRITLFGESKPMRQSFAQNIMNKIEEEIDTLTGWKRKGIWKASHPCPSSVFPLLAGTNKIAM